MIYQTKYFGTIECGQEELFHFPAGLPGFEEERNFLLIPFESSGGSMLSLQSAVTPALSFVVMDPFSLTADYTPVLAESDLSQLGVEQWDQLSYCVLCVVKNPVSESTVNLKCPIALHLDRREGRQIIMDTERYGMRHLLTEFRGREETSSC